MHIFGKDQQAFHLQRTETERWWSRLNVVIVIVQLACFLAAIIRTSTNAGNSMSNSFFAISPLQLKAPYLQYGCSYNVTRTHAFFRNVQYTMSPDNVGYFVSRGALNIRYLMAITAVHTAVSMLNRLWFETNTHEIRYHFVVFRKDMVTTWEVLLMVLGMVMTWSVTRENQIMSDYLAACDASNNGAYYNSVQPYTELIVSYIVSIAITVINALFAIWNLSKENPRVAMMKEDQKRKEEWEKAMREYYGLPDPAAGGGGTPGGNHDNTSAGAPPQPLVTYANNQAATTSAGTAQGNASQQAAPPQQPHHHHHNYHDAIRRGFRKPFSALSGSLRGRTQAGDPVVAAQRQQHHVHRPSASPGQNGRPSPSLSDLPPQQQQQQQQLSLAQQQQMAERQRPPQPPYSGQPPREPPHVGPSVSRPLTPLLNEEYDDAEDDDVAMVVAPPVSEGRSPVGPLDRRTGQPQVPPQQQQPQQQPQRVSSSHSGRYDLREVDYDDEAYDSVNVDVTHSSPRRPASSSNGPGVNSHNMNVRSSNGNGLPSNMNMNNNGVQQQQQQQGGRRAPASAAAASDTSTALLNARMAAVPPPPPVFSGDRRQNGQMGRNQMLAPPSPLQGNGAETTDDTVLQ